jgi:hypothetical protein
MVTDGAIDSVTVNGGTPVTNPLTNVDFQLLADFTVQNIFPFGGNQIFLVASFSPTGGTDFTITQTGEGTILEGNLTSTLFISGILDIMTMALNTGPGAQALVLGANIAVTGGDPNLVAALGGGGTNYAILEVTGGVFNFVPNATVLLNLPGGPYNMFDDNFTFAASGTITPLANSPFVPEPATALLLGSGLLGMLAIGRRARRSQRR